MTTEHDEVHHHHHHHYEKVTVTMAKSSDSDNEHENDTIDQSVVEALAEKHVGKPHAKHVHHHHRHRVRRTPHAA